MSPPSAPNIQNFRAILTRNIAVPLAIGVVSAALFGAIIAYLLSVLGWVEHTDHVIASASQIQKLSIDQETAMRGFLITGDETFLGPYEVAKPMLGVEAAALRQLVSDNPPQVNRMDRITALQGQWDKFAQDMIALRRNGGDYLQAVRSGARQALDRRNAGGV